MQLIEKSRGVTVWDVEIPMVDQGIMKVLVDAESGTVIWTEGKIAGKQA